MSSQTFPDIESFAISNDRTLFSRLAYTYESAVVYLLAQQDVQGIAPATLRAFQASYASTAFRCRFPHCERLSSGFATAQLRLEHETVHVQRVYCQTVSCQYNRIGFGKRTALNAHTRRYHGQTNVLLIPAKVRRTTIVEAEAGAPVLNSHQPNPSSVALPNISSFDSPPSNHFGVTKGQEEIVEEQEEEQQLFSITPEQYNSMTSLDFARSQDSLSSYHDPLAPGDLMARTDPVPSEHSPFVNQSYRPSQLPPRLERDVLDQSDEHQNKSPNEQPRSQRSQHEMAAQLLKVNTSQPGFIPWSSRVLHVDPFRQVAVPVDEKPGTDCDLLFEEDRYGSFIPLSPLNSEEALPELSWSHDRPPRGSNEIETRPARDDARTQMAISFLTGIDDDVDARPTNEGRQPLHHEPGSKGETPSPVLDSETPSPTTENSFAIERMINTRLTRRN